jgi:hypothetical protein
MSPSPTEADFPGEEYEEHAAPPLPSMTEPRQRQSFSFHRHNTGLDVDSLSVYDGD